MDRKRIIVAATGASGTALLIDVLKEIRKADGFSSVLILSDNAKLTASYESDMPVTEIEKLADEVMDVHDIGAGPASGSFKTEGMIIVPCSMKTVAGINSGYSDNLILRAADVTIKEQRPLVLAVREAPLSAIHLRNMAELSAIPGVRIVPPLMTFYNRPESIEEMISGFTSRALEPFGITTSAYKRWQDS